MGTINHTPDPAEGALIDASGVIELPDDNENMKADNIQLGDQQLADWMAFLSKGPTNDSNYKITGNGTPPAGGYTPLTNPIRINGTGFALNNAPLNLSAGATVTGTYTTSAAVTQTGARALSGSGAIDSIRPTTLPPTNTTGTLSVSADSWRQTGTLLAGINHEVKSTGPVPPNGSRVRVYKRVTAFDVVLLREDATEICTLPAANFASADLIYETSVGEWNLCGGYGLDLTTATPLA